MHKRARPALPGLKGSSCCGELDPNPGDPLHGLGNSASGACLRPSHPGTKTPWAFLPQAPPLRGCWLLLGLSGLRQFLALGALEKVLERKDRPGDTQDSGHEA